MDIDKFFNKVNPFEWETTEPKEYRDFGKNDMIKFAKMYVEAINYSQCCETLKCKEETDFELWLKNFEESDGCYWFDKETLYVKQAMKEIYEKEVKPKL